MILVLPTLYILFSSITILFSIYGRIAYSPFPVKSSFSFYFILFTSSAFFPLVKISGCLYILSNYAKIVVVSQSFRLFAVRKSNIHASLAAWLVARGNEKKGEFYCIH